ncbi:hypothetical protein [Methanobacterium oryzae]|uniref:hypothetical protein n=1 Tax=Methanobacterium oryzae TaxID=69540 RepID=UPI003D243FC9
MKKKIFFSIIFLLILLSTTSVAFADVIEPGMKEIKYYYKISNIDNYPDYIFLAHGTPSPTVEIVNSSEFSFYKFSTVSVYAIKKSDFSENELKNMDDEELEDFFKNDSRVIPSDIELQGSYKNVVIANPLDKALVVLEVTSINENKLEIEKSKIIYRYVDGTEEEEKFVDQNITPEPSKNSVSFWSSQLFYVIISFLAIIVIGVILIARRYK